MIKLSPNTDCVAYDIVISKYFYFGFFTSHERRERIQLKIVRRLHSAPTVQCVNERIRDTRSWQPEMFVDTKG